MIAQIAPAVLRARLVQSEGELALLDVREQGAFAHGHILLAATPRSAAWRSTRRAWCPGAAPPWFCATAVMALAAARRRDARPATAIATSRCSTAASAVGAPRGFVLFEGVYVPSKAFGEFVEATWGTPHLSADELARLRAEGPERGRARQPADERVPADEHPRRHRRAGGGAGPSRARSRSRPRYPGRGQLRRAHAQHHRRAVADQRRDRQPGRRARERHHGLDARRPRARARPGARAAAAERGGSGVGATGGRAGRRQVRRAHSSSTPRSRAFAREAEARTLYLFDVRSPEEYAAGHLPGAAVHARRPAGPGDRRLPRDAQCQGGPDRRRRRARHHDRVLADPDGLARGLRAAGRAGRRSGARPGAHGGARPRRARSRGGDGRADPEPEARARRHPGPRLRRQPRLPRRSHPRRVVAQPRAPRSGSEGRAAGSRLRR